MKPKKEKEKNKTQLSQEQIANTVIYFFLIFSREPQTQF